MSVLAQVQVVSDLGGVPLVLAASSLVALALIVAWRLRLGVERDIVIAAIRATVQLLAVGVLFTAIFTSRYALWWAWVWVLVMVVISTTVVRRRARRPLAWLGVAAGGAHAVCAAVVVMRAAPQHP